MPTGVPSSSVCGTNTAYQNGCRCEPCRAANKTYRQSNPDLFKARAKAHRQKRLGLMLKFKSQPCKDCGNTFPPYCMDFDHREPDEKLFSISGQQTCSEALFLAEVAKCDVVCANCHRIRTFKDKAYIDAARKRGTDEHESEQEIEQESK